jgi:hypothetical protein
MSSLSSYWWEWRQRHALGNLMSSRTVSRLNKLEAGRLPDPDSLFLLWVKPGTPLKEQTAQIHALGLSASLDGVICAEWQNKEKMPAPRWLRYRDIPRDELNVLSAKIREVAGSGPAEPTDHRTAQYLRGASDRDLLAKIFSVGALSA